MLVRNEGPRNAPLVLIGDAPGAREEQTGIPFTGPNGGRLEVWWRQMGLSRGDFYLTYVLDYRPENIDRVPREVMERAFGALLVRLSLLDCPIIIIPTGNYSLYALTGKGKVSWHKKDGPRLVRPGILDWRGSILSVGLNDRTVKIIPTIHPNRVLGTPSLERRTLADWARIANEVTHICRDGVVHFLPCIACGQVNSPLNLPEVYHNINPTIEEVEAFATYVRTRSDPVGLDIETPRGKVTEFAVVKGEVITEKTLKNGKTRTTRKEIVEWRSDVKKTDERTVAIYKSGKKKGELKTKQKAGRSYIGCVGLANNESAIIVVPLTNDYWKDATKTQRARNAFDSILNSNAPLVVQNGVTFDLPRLIHDGYTVRTIEEGGMRDGKPRIIWDTRCMHHAIDPRDDHDLAYMASIYTRFPFWKHEAKDPETLEKYTKNSEALRAYCGIDVASMMDIFYQLLAMHVARGATQFFYDHYIRLIPCVLDMTMHGIQVDNDKRREVLEGLNGNASFMASKITELAGMSLIVKKGLSNDRLKFLFYGIKGFEGPKGEATFQKLAAAYPAVTMYNLPPMRKKNTKGGRSITVDEVALRKLMIRHPKIKDIGTLLLDYRRNRKMAEFLDAKALDPDYRLRCSYSFVTEAGRFASQSNPWGTGRNLQNIDRELRYVFVPDKE